MPNPQTTFRNVSLPRSGPGMRTVWLVFLSTFTTAAVMGCVAVYSWYVEAQTQIAEVHPATLEWSAESVVRRLDQALDRAERLAATTNPASSDAALAARSSELLAASSLFSGLVFLDAEGNVRASDGRGIAYQQLLGILEPKHAIDSELFDVMEGVQLRRELAGVRSALMRLLSHGDDRAWVILSAPLPRTRSRAATTLHALLRSDVLADQLHLDLLAVGGLHLADKEGRIIALAGEVSPDGPLPSEALRAGAIPHLEVPWTTGIGWTVRSALPIGMLDLSITAEQPVLLAFTPMLIAASWILAAGAVLGAAFTLLASLLAMSSTRRLQVLFDGFRALAKDDFETRLPQEHVRGQIQHLYRGFNAAADHLAKVRGQALANVEVLSKQNLGFQKHHEHLSKLSITDGLTDLHNHRYFQDQLSKEIKRLTRTHEGLSILILDIDDFKKLNDTFGHAAGDEFLKQLARILTESVRATDLLARYGGEEFVVIATGTKLAGAQLLAEKLRTKIAETSFIVDESMRPQRVTVSIGVSEYVHSRTGLFTSADAALYRAKAAGKNCVMTAEPPESPESSA
ncbi:MAG: diguanylate cyclase [Deltaproteobacteria bacterium]|nr:diguanylate cyclase [Deltaproteobacteria bacterium]MBW2384969.1 diguanylate cyclase [Deltaproteobacteria bacterium]